VLEDKSARGDLTHQGHLASTRLYRKDTEVLAPEMIGAGCP
jgi:hypothetical protein